MEEHMKNKFEKYVTIRPITLEDYSVIVDWSRDKAFCSANGWEQNRSNEEIYRWWNLCVSGEIENFIRMGMEYGGPLIQYRFIL